MTRLRVLALTGTLLLLGATSSAALVKPPSVHAGTGDQSPQSRALLMARDYHATFNSGMRTGEFSSLASMFAAKATVTMYSALAGSTSRDQIDLAHGRAAITGVYKTFYASFSGYQWGKTRVLRATATQVVSTEQVRNPHAGYAPRMETIFVIRDGKIQRLDWTVFFGRQQ